jgi:hypothetical protein
MLLTFENHYVVAVVVFMLSMLFCKHMLECVQTCIHVWQSCASPMCQDLCFCPCVHYGHAELLRHSLLAALLFFSVGQPILLLIIKRITENMLERQSFWTVNVGYVLINTTAFQHTSNATGAAASTPEGASRLSFSELDGLFLVMPFTLAAACTTWMWVSLRHVSFFQSDPEWGPELFSDPRMQLYELLYALEVFALLFALLSLVADPAPVEYILVYAMLLSFLLLYFCSQSRRHGAAHHTEHTLSMLMFSLLSTLVSFFVVQHWSGGCSSKRSAGVLLICVLPALAICHMSTTEDTRAGNIILLRTFVSCTCSLYFVLLASLNPNSWC